MKYILTLLLMVFCFASPTDCGAEDSQIQVLVAKNSSAEEDDWGGEHEGIWPREIVRQQILLIAREEFGAYTRDESLGEPIGNLKGAVELTLNIAAYATVNGDLHLRLTDDEGDSLLESDYEFNTGVLAAYKSLIRVARDEVSVDVRKALAKLGLKKLGRRQQSESKVSDDLNRDMNLLGQLELLQAAHTSHRQAGQLDSLELIVESNANLGLLTLDYWNSTSDVFFVRALLYAELLVDESNESTRSLAFRSYAKALAGLHRWAAEDALKVEKAYATNAKDADVPVWNALILPYCRFQPSKIVAIGEAEPAVKNIAELMQFRIAISGNDKFLINAAAKKLIRKSPLSFQTLSWLSPGPTHALLRRSALEYFSRATNQRLIQNPNLPDEVAEQLEEALSRPDEQIGATAIRTTSELSRGLMKAEFRPIEPSPNLTGRIMFEELFVQVVNQLQEFSDGTKADNSAAVDIVHSFVDEHPYERYVKFLGVDQETARRKSYKLLDGFDFLDPRPTMSRACFYLFHIKTPQHDKFGYHVWQNIDLDYTETRMSQRLRGAQLLNYGQNALVAMGKQLGRVSPYAPAAVRLQISRLEKIDDVKLKRFRKMTREDPTGMEFLAGQLQANERYDEAIELLDRALQLSPSVNRYISLANAQYAVGEPDQWHATLEAYLQEENQGLSHARVHNELALGLMGQGKLKEAKPYALNAAATWSAWGMKTASLVLEGLQEWEESETWIKRSSENYAGVTRSDWYMWCKRNGRGDLDGAAEQFDIFLRSPYSKNQHDVYLKATREILEDQPNVAQRLLVQGQRIDDSAWTSKTLALVAAKHGDKKHLRLATDDLKQRLHKLEEQKFPIEHWVISEIIRTLTDPANVTAPDYAAADELLSQANSNELADTCYVVGALAALAGDTEKATEYWRRALASRAFHRYTVTLAGFELNREE